MTAIQRFAIHGTIMNPHSNGPYVRHEDHLAAMQARCLAQIEEPAQPVCWIRFCSDGSTEGPIMHSQICEARKTSGAWTPLYAGAAPAAVAGPALDVTLDEDQAGLLRDMLGDHAEYPEAITVRLMVGDGHSGHGLYVAQAEYQDEGAVLLASLPAPAAPALEAPATSLRDAAANALAALERTQHASDADRLAAADQLRAALAAAPQAPAAPSAIATQVIENLLQLARIVNTAVEDWGESFEDGSSEVTFHKEEADKLEEILEFFDSLPDAPPEEGVILSGPSRAARVLRAMAAPAAPVVDAGGQVLGEWPRVSGVGRDAESPRTLLLYLQTEASDDELRAIHDALLDGGALATHALSELMHIGYRVEGGKLVPPENLSVRASEFFGVTAVAAKATAVHSDDVAVDRFAVEMKAKLAAARAKGRGGWETCPPEVLSRMLREHADKGDPRDVANFCMFLWSLGQPISVAAPAAPAVDAQGARDAAFEAVRNRLCSLQRYSFVLDDDGIVRRAHDRTGSWIEFDDAHALFDPVAVDAAIAAQAKEGGAPVADAAPLDVCTDPYNCARCKTHPAHRGDMHHAGISRIGGSA